MASEGKFSILDLMDALPWFKTGASWANWRAFLAALYGLPMTSEMLAIYRKCTGRKTAPSGPFREAWVPVGRRGRKSAIAALIGVWHSAFKDHVASKAVAPGTKATAIILSDKKANARAIHGYASAILQAPALKHLLASAPTTEGISLTTGVDMEIKPASISTGRSPSTCVAILDEIAFFRTDDSANPDWEIIQGIKPGMVTFPDALLIGLSSPYAKRGVLWDAYQKHFGKDDSPVLVWQADTLTMHDSPQVRAEVEREYKADPISAAAEYGAQFRSDVQAFITEEFYDSCVSRGVDERAPTKGLQYWAFTDPSGGRVDAYTLSICHVEYPAKEAPAKGLSGVPVVVQDYLGVWASPLDPYDVVKEQIPILHRYGLKGVTGDKYGGDIIPAMYAKWGVGYIHASKSKSQYYLDMLPLMSAGQVKLLDRPEQRKEFLGLDRSTSRQGRDTVDHQLGKNDDAANAAAGAVVEAAVMLRSAPVHPEKTFTKPDGTPDWNALKMQEFRDRLKQSQDPDDGFEGPERYRYMR